MRGEVSAQYPRALAICDRCGARYNHFQLSWQYQWAGPRLRNVRILVCETCLDTPQEQLRTIILPPDPMPIMNPRPEASVQDLNPLSGIGMSPNLLLPQYGNFIGNLSEGGGLNAVFDANTNKPSVQSASISVSNSSYDNWIGMNWTGNNTPDVTPAVLTEGVVTHSLSGVTLTAPNDQPFLASGFTNYVVQGSSIGGSVWEDWTTLASGATAGDIGEEIDIILGGGTLYQYHRVAFQGDGATQISVAQAAMSVAEIGGPI